MEKTQYHIAPNTFSNDYRIVRFPHNKSEEGPDWYYLQKNGNFTSTKNEDAYKTKREAVGYLKKYVKNLRLVTKDIWRIVYENK